MRHFRVVLADDHAGIRKVIRSILEKTQDIRVVGEASNGIEALECVREYEPDVLVLDMEMPVLDGVAVVKRLTEDGLDVNVLALSSYDDPYYIREVLKYGASGYIIKDEPPDRLVEAIRKVGSGHRGVYNQKVAEMVRKDFEEE